MKLHTLFLMSSAEKIVKKFASENLVVRRDFFGMGKECSLIFCPDLTKDEVQERAIRAITRSHLEASSLEQVAKEILTVREIRVEAKLNNIVDAMLLGDTALVIEGLEGALILDSKAWDSRGISEPPVENVITGPREGFTENLKTNLQCIQRRIRSPKLVLERFKVGKKSNTNVAIMFIKGVADEKIVSEIKKRIKSIDIDAIYDTTSLEPFLEQRPFSIFKQVGYSERPDIISSKINEGRVAILVDGSPIVLTLPYLLIEDFHSAGDYYQKAEVATFLRILRFVAVSIALILPGIYVAMLQFNFDLLPLNFLMSVLNAQRGTPLPPLFEVLLIMFFFEVLRESALRLPKVIGLAMGIVGGIILGEAAILSGLLSPASVLIVALSSISLFTVPGSIGTTMLLRIVFTLLGGLLGLFGILLFALYIVHYLSGFQFYFTPHLAPFAPLIKGDLKDSIIKRPIFEFIERPKTVAGKDKVRQGRAER